MNSASSVDNWQRSKRSVSRIFKVEAPVLLMLIYSSFDERDGKQKSPACDRRSLFPKIHFIKRLICHSRQAIIFYSDQLLP